ncbi:GLPGLI family protein [Chryseobacterium piscicola]|uniref:GLPGLI family protein n=1 Tax=Chryseobacterium piscicola TaxID=551459 RepID=A0A1N7KSA3_9FLAO|nr:GLPGLI family protein [Chryseobacterium piscicola]PQA94982.1 hypothetical protein B0A70_06585 [Chryseobacterium piscicola]SIS64431.1 GLPGLI family protein [Chryseobacterium piscicola]
MKFLLLLCNIVSIFNCAQNYKVTYKFDYKKDSLSSDYESVFMILDINKTTTKFYYNKLLKYDSLYRKGMQLSYANSLQQLLTRKKASNENNNFVFIQDKYFMFSTIDDIKWEIKDSTKIANSYKLQMAETAWGGRKWIAWFCSEIPISEGPYKFRGLPGLVMEVLDTKKNYLYNLVFFEKRLTEYDTNNILETHFGNKPLKINTNIYKKLLVDEYNNPFAEYQNMEDNNKWELDYFGKIVNTKQGLRDITREYRINLKKNYNPIELDKAVKYTD